MCNYVDPSSDVFVSELCITSSGKDILPDLVAGAEPLVAASGASSDKLHFEAFSPSVAGRGKAEAILSSGENGPVNRTNRIALR